jgi:hypothetical protein
MNYLELLDRLHVALWPRAYLEIGIEAGATLSLSRSRSVAIDPGPRASAEALLAKPWVKVLTMTSDDFFRSHTSAATLEGHPLDLAVIDGLHQFAQVVRDLENIERWAHPGTVVVIHDVLPENAWQANRIQHGGAWTGDVWRIVHFLSEYRTELACHLLAVPPSGALIVTGLNPQHQGMSDIAAELDRSFPTDGPDYERLVETWLASANPLDPEEVLRQFEPTPRTADVRLEGKGWTQKQSAWVPEPGAHEGRIRIVPVQQVRQGHRGRIAVNARGMQVLRIRFHYTGPGGPRYRNLFLDVSHPGAAFHGLGSLWLDADSESGRIEFDWESQLGPDEALSAITIVPVDIWLRETPLHGEMSVILDRVVIERNALPRAGARFTAERFPDRPVARMRERGQRDAVIFAWRIPDNRLGLDAGEYYLGLLRYHHADSKLFLALDPRSDPAWAKRLASSGLDVAIVPVDPALLTGADTGTLLAALGAFSRCSEEFDLVWFGYTRGASIEQSDGDRFTDFRFQQDRELWARRADVDRFFADPKIGLFAPRYGSYATPYFDNGVPGRGAAELDALERIYRDEYAPLGIWARNGVFVTRAKIVRQFCDTVGDGFFRREPREYGAGRWWFEAAFPSIASMQGYEPFIETESGGTAVPDDLALYDDRWRANRQAMKELQRWRLDPLAFRPRAPVTARPGALRPRARSSRHGETVPVPEVSRS